MSRQITGLDPAIAAYIEAQLPPEDPVERELRERTAQLPEANMQIARTQGHFMQLLLRLMGARRTIEIGVFTGYSTLLTARAIGPDGCIVACDISEQWTAIAREFWQRAGVADRIELRIAPAIVTLQALIDDGQADSFDFAFIDADKTGYLDYYEACLRLLRPGGLVALDNALWGGAVVDPARHDAEVRALRAVAERVRDDDRVDSCLVASGDGLLLARKREPA